METLRLVLVFLHILGLSSLIGGYLTQLSAPVKLIVPAMLHGAHVQFVTGIALVGVRQVLHSDDEVQWPVDHAKWGVKLLVVIIILGLMGMASRRESVPVRAFHAVGLLAVLNVAIAIFW